MSDVLDKATVVNRALARIGLSPTFSIGDESFVAGKIDLIWPDVVSHTFGLHDWDFCRLTRPLHRLSETPVNGWTYAFQLPGDRLGAPLKLLAQVGDPEAPLRSYTIEADKVFAHEAAVWARCKVAVDPAAWDPAFASAFVTALASALAIPMMQDEQLAADLSAKAYGTPSQGGGGGEFGRLMSQHRAGEPVGSPLLAYDPLTSARYQ